MTTATRTVQVRIEVANPDAKLKPDMYADDLAFEHDFIDTARLLQMVHLEITQYCRDSVPNAVAKN